jgi:predicted outer membrane repeat protein
MTRPARTPRRNARRARGGRPRLTVEAAACAAILLLIAGFPLTASGEIWHVEHDPGDPDGLVGAAVAGAADGDTILVGPGTYFEHIPIEGKSLVLRSLEGPRETILDGSKESFSQERAILYTTTGGGSLYVEGFTFRNGGGAEGKIGIPQGGAVSWWDLEGEATFAALDCRFLDNVSGDDGSSTGGAIYLEFMERAEIADCFFSGNRARHNGGAVSIQGYPGEYTIRDCEFVLDDESAVWGDAIYAPNTRTMRILSSRFLSDTQGPSTTLSLGCENVTIAYNTFEGAGGPTGLSLYEGGFEGEVHYTVEIRSNLLWSAARAPEGVAVIDMGYTRCTVDLSHNTFAFASLVWGSSTGTITCANNIFYETPAWFSTGGSGEFSCNDAWPSGMEIAGGGQSTEADNISEDPDFCDEAGGDFRLIEGSPCSPEGGPDGCGFIGSVEDQCSDQTPVERITWGRIKSRWER